MKLRAVVPATVANIGPGFDCLAMALDLCNELELDTEAEGGVAVEGEGTGELPTDGSNVIVRAMEHLARQAGAALPAFSLRCVNRIPLERGLGSSAAAVVGGLILADRLLGTALPQEELFRQAVGLEGHADNVAAALRGGLVFAYTNDDGGWSLESATPSPALRPAVLIPHGVRLATAKARRALPEEVPLADAVFNAAHAALVVLALTERPELLGEALQDRLHQPYRLPLIPPVAMVFHGLREAGVPVCLAGAGPSLLAFRTEEVAIPDPGPGWRVLSVTPRSRGTEIQTI